MKRPRGAYQPLPLTAPGYDGGDVDSAEDAGIAVPTPPWMDGGDAPTEDGAAPADPLAALQGDYMVRFDNETEIDDRELGLVESTTTTYGVMRVVLRDGKLVANEWLCSSDNQQTAEEGSIRTTFEDVVWNALTPVTRELTVDLEAGTWATTGPSTRRQGWKASAGEMPTDPNRTPEAFLDPEGDGPGLTMTVNVDATALVVPVRATCRYDIVAASSTEYTMGLLDDAGRLASARVKAGDPQVHAWRASRVSGASECKVEQVNDARDPDIVRDELTLARLPDWLEVTETAPKPCPSAATFRGALP